MGIFGGGNDPRDALIGAKQEEIDRLWKLVERLQAQNIALADSAAARQVGVAPPRPAATPQKRPDRVRNPPWVQSAIGDGHIDIVRERARITGQQGAIRDVGTVGPPKAEGA